MRLAASLFASFFHFLAHRPRAEHIAKGDAHEQYSRDEDDVLEGHGIWGEAGWLMALSPEALSA